ncbi:HlyD family efflux transporter periplasmic adaptor subunit [Teichococcus aestuarii]|uniref:HlyD family efflux transporter periplasmic adaptor subunit n=1 Tax=Teichococcus aestuarii TaxID=568898 RepID=UPI00360A860F
MSRSGPQRRPMRRSVTRRQARFPYWTARSSRHGCNSGRWRPRSPGCATTTPSPRNRRQGSAPCSTKATPHERSTPSGARSARMQRTSSRSLWRSAAPPWRPWPRRRRTRLPPWPPSGPTASRIQELRRAVMALEGDVSKRLRRQERLTVGSPVRGIVKSLEVTTIGGVAGAGQPLAVIVPLDEMLHAETRLPVSQIGHVRPGLPVHVKISAYDFTRFGWIEGRVSRVSPSSFSGDGMAYYKVQVDLASNHLPLAPRCPALALAWPSRPTSSPATRRSWPIC